MTLKEIVLCLAAFCIASLPLLLLSRSKTTSKTEIALALTIGFIVANAVSFWVSKAGDKLAGQPIPLTDLPIYFGFPLSYLKIGPWDNDMLWFPLIANIAIVIILTLLISRIHREKQP